MTEAVGTDYADKIRKLLALAENAGTPEEAETFTAKAMQLMDKYAITMAMIGATKEQDTDEIVTHDITYTGIYRDSHRELAYRVASGHRCKIVYTNMTWSTPKKSIITMHGFRSDMETVNLLVTSLQLQCTTALKAWEREQSPFWHERAAFAKFKDRRQFIESFAFGVAGKLRASMDAAKTEAAAERVAASHDSETMDEATTGVELALRSRTERVQDWFDQRYGNSLRAASNRSRASGSAGASNAGYSAGRNADTGQTRVGGGRRAIGK